MIIGAINHIIRIYLEDGEYMPGLNKLKDLLMTQDSILFCRDFGFYSYNCDELNEIFQILEMNPEESKMIIGHSIQDEVNSICDDRVWRIDLGLSRAFDDIEIGDYQLIEYKMTADNGLQWLVKFLRKKLNKFIEDENNKKELSIIKFKYNESKFNEVEILTHEYDLYIDNYNSLIDKLILYFRLNKKEYHVQLLNNLKEQKVNFYPIDYTSI